MIIARLRGLLVAGAVIGLGVGCGESSSVTGADVPDVSDPSVVGRADDVPADDVPTDVVPTGDGLADGADGSPTTAPAEVPGSPSITLVPDPRPGDLRVDADADVLPADYEAPVAASTSLDVAYGPDPGQRLDLHLPDEDFAPVVLFIHGGGWGPGGRAPVPQMVMRFVERGFAVASVEYRGAPEHLFPAAVEDVKRAIRWLKQESRREGLINGEQIVLYGGSSGGQLAALVAATPGRFEPEQSGTEEGDGATIDPTVAAVVSLAGPSDFRTMFPDPHPWAEGAIESWLGCSPCSDDRLAEASPIIYLGADLPPAYWGYGGADPIVSATAQGRAIADVWGELVGPENSWFDLVDGQGHDIDHTMINQRFLERFVDQALDRSRESEIDE